MAKKTPVIWSRTTRNREASFIRGLIVSDYKEIFPSRGNWTPTRKETAATQTTRWARPRVFWIA